MAPYIAQCQIALILSNVIDIPFQLIRCLFHLIVENSVECSRDRRPTRNRFALSSNRGHVQTILLSSPIFWNAPFLSYLRFCILLILTTNAGFSSSTHQSLTVCLQLHHIDKNRSCRFTISFNHLNHVIYLASPRCRLCFCEPLRKAGPLQLVSSLPQFL